MVSEYILCEFNVFTFTETLSYSLLHSLSWRMFHVSLRRMYMSLLMGEVCYISAVPNLFGTREQFCGRQFFRRPGRGDGFRMVQAHYIYCALYFYDYYIVIYNEIIIQLTVMQNQWEP